MRHLSQIHTLRIATLVLPLLMLHCKTKPQPTDVTKKMDSIIISLQVEPATFSIANTAHTTMTFRVRNEAHHTVNIDPHHMEILVTGQVNATLNVGINNGIFDKNWSDLPAKQEVTRTMNSLVPVLFDQVGTYQLEPKMNGKSGATITVTVTE